MRKRGKKPKPKTRAMLIRELEALEVNSARRMQELWRIVDVRWDEIRRYRVALGEIVRTAENAGQERIALYWIVGKAREALNS